MTVRRVSILSWTKGTTEIEIADFMDWADRHFATAPFVYAAHGRTTQGAGDWAYIIDFDGLEDAAEWMTHPFHKELSIRIGGGYAEPPFQGMLDRSKTQSFELELHESAN